MVISGRNGSGKSTLVKILCHVLSPSRGKVEYLDGGKPLPERVRLASLGLVSPYLQLYEEFSAFENLQYALAIRGGNADAEGAMELLRRVSLGERAHDPVGTYSSGMKQRAKFALALVHRPSVLVVDEPMANLDAEGMSIVRGIMEEHRREGILVVATNDLTDVERYDHAIDLNAQK